MSTHKLDAIYEGMKTVISFFTVASPALDETLHDFEKSSAAILSQEGKSENEMLYEMQHDYAKHLPHQGEIDIEKFKNDVDLIRYLFFFAFSSLEESYDVVTTNPFFVGSSTSPE